MPSTPEAVRNRVLILTPFGRDSQLACSVLEQDRLAAEVCPSISDLLRNLEAGAAAAVIAEEVLNGDFQGVGDWVKNQPAWSDFPFIVLTSGRPHDAGMRRHLELARPLGNVTLLERPVRSFTLLSVVKAALRARTRQYEVEHSIQEIRRAEADRAEAYAREQAAHAQIELLNHIGEILAAEFSVDALLPAVTDAATNLIGAQIGVCFAEDPNFEDRRFRLRCTSRITFDDALALLGDHAGVLSAELSGKRVIHWPQTGEPGAGWLDDIARKLSLRNCIALPVSSRREVMVGVLLFGSCANVAFTARQERVAASLAAQAAIAIDNARLFTESEQEKKRLDAARQALQRSNEELRQFAYVASHDLKEPLRTVASFTQLLVSRYRGQGGSEADEFVSYIVNGVERMSSLINDLLQYSQSGVVDTLPTAPSSAEAALDQVLLSLAAAIQESGAVVTHDPLPDVWIDTRSLILLFQNLVANAIKYRGQQPLHVHISAESSGGDWIFSVRDNGIGIAPAYHERIFGIFKRLHGKEIPGTGIGLAICHRIVDWHGGRIWVESEAGAGATFRFTLPKEPQRIRQEMAEFSASGSSAG